MMSVLFRQGVKILTQVSILAHLHIKPIRSIVIREDFFFISLCHLCDSAQKWAWQIGCTRFPFEKQAAETYIYLHSLF